MMKQDTIAVITTIYRGDNVAFAREAFNSIINQTLKGFEVRVYLHVDGEITPEQNLLLDDFRKLFYKIIVSRENIGLALGLNRLLESLADERYIFRMDIDDISLPHRFETQINFLEKNPHIDLCGCCSTEIDEAGRVLFQRDYPEFHHDIVARLPRCNPILHPTYCIRGSTMRSQPLRYRPLNLNEDLGFVFDAVATGWRVHNLPERLFCWRLGPRFFARRSLRRSWIEFCVYTTGCWRLWGLNYRLIWPVVRLATRLAPKSFMARIYQSSLRNNILGRVKN